MRHIRQACAIFDNSIPCTPPSKRFMKSFMAATMTASRCIRSTADHLGGSPACLNVRFGFRVSGLEFRISGLGFRVEGLGCRVWGVGCRVWRFSHVCRAVLHLCCRTFHTPRLSQNPRKMTAHKNCCEDNPNQEITRSGLLFQTTLHSWRDWIWDARTIT